MEGSGGGSEEWWGDWLVATSGDCSEDGSVVMSADWLAATSGDWSVALSGDWSVETSGHWSEALLDARLVATSGDCSEDSSVVMSADLLAALSCHWSVDWSALRSVARLQIWPDGRRVARMVHW